VGGEARPTDKHFMRGSRFQLPDHCGVETPLKPGPVSGDSLEGPGKDNLVGRLPYVREVPHEGRLSGEGGIDFPACHSLVHATPVELGASPSLEVADETVHLFIWFGPVELAVFVFYIPVKRGDRRIDQLTQSTPPTRSATSLDP